MARTTASWLIAVAVLGAGCAPKPGEAAKRIIKVEVVTVAPAPMVDQLTVRAAIEPWQSVHLSAEVPGRLVFVGRDEGQPVARGERLYGIDRASYAAQLSQAEATAAYHVTNCARSETLFGNKAISRDQLDKARADRDAALAAVEVAKAELAKTDTFSPIDGVLDAKLAEVGEFMSAGSPLGDIVDVSRVKVIVPVPEKDVIHVKAGATMSVMIDALESAPREGKVIFIKQVADAATLTFPVHMELANDDGSIRPGMIARVLLVRQRFAEAISVPLFAVVRRADGYYVFVEEGGVARQRRVVLGFPEGDRWRVVEGLSVGERLIIRGQRDLVDGDEVEVVPGAADAAPATDAGEAVTVPEAEAGVE